MTAIAEPQVYFAAPEIPEKMPEPEKEPRTASDRVCVHRGRPLREVDGPGLRRGHRVRVTVYACRRHGECTQKPVGVRSEDQTRLLRACETCRDYRPAPEPAADSPPEPDKPAAPSRPDFSVPVSETKPAEPKPAPDVRGFLVNARGEPADFLREIFAGRPCFLLCGGPSLADMDLSPLRQPGILTAAVNNAAVLFRPHLWFCVDKPGHFHEIILRDPAVMKFTKRNLSRVTARTWNGQAWVDTGIMVRHLPNFWFFEHSTFWDPQQFLTCPKPTWGTVNENDPEGRGTRSCMLPALRILFWLGVRTIYLLGCDFNMTPQRTYAFDEPKDARACGSNNNSYARLNKWFRELRPHFAEYGLSVYNCTPGGHLHAFPRKPFHEAVAEARRDFPDEIHTRGLYHGYR